MKYDAYLIEAMARRKEALKMRRKNATYKQIGEALGVSRQRAFSMVKRAKAEV